jgi:hypothetical protein
MQYTIDVYQKNAKKCGRIHQMEKEADDILNANREAEKQIENLLNEVVSTFSGNKEPLNFDYNGEPIFIGNGGLYHIPSWRRTKSKLPMTFDVIKAITEPKILKLFPARREIEKKTLLILRNCVKDLSYKEIVIGREINKKIKTISVYSTEVKEKTAIRIKCTIGHEVILHVDFEGVSNRYSEETYMTIDKSVSGDMVTEQLYLDLWRVLVKAIKRAKKKKIKTFKTLAKLQRDTSHILVAKEI